MKKYSWSFPLLGLLAVLVVYACTGVNASPKQSAEMDLDAETKACIDCHENERVAPKVHDQWASSAHAKNGIGCMSWRSTGQGNDCHL